jgi:iron complex transport system substrate-binding protein
VKKKFLKLLTINLLLILLANCSSQEKAESEKQRLVITSPEVAEIVYELAGSFHIVGITQECDYPPELRSIPSVGTFGKVDIEKVVSISPDLVFVAGGEQDYLAAELEKLDIRVKSIKPGSIEELLQSVAEIARLIGAEKAGEKLIEELKSKIESLKAKQKGIKPRIYVEVYNQPVMSVSDESFVGELVELAGFNNIFSSLPRDYSRIDVEEVLEADPEYILILYPGVSRQQIAERKGWGEISAVQSGRIITPEDIDTDLLVRASPRSLEGAILLNNIKNKAND